MKRFGQRGESTRAGDRAWLSVLLLSAVVCSITRTAARCDEPAATTPTDAARQDAELLRKSLARLQKVTVRGRCIDENGAALEGALIRVFRFPAIDKPPVEFLETRTDASGAFEFRDVRSEVRPAARNVVPDLIVTASKPGYSSAYEPVGATAPGDELQLQLSPHVGRLSGVVLDGLGRPVKDATVCIAGPILHPLPGVLNDITDEHGRFVIGDLQRTAVVADWRFGGGRAQACLVIHPDFAPATKLFADVPQEVEIALKSYRRHSDTPTGRLLDRLQSCCAESRPFTDVWARTLRDLIRGGPAGLPELIEELDASTDRLMIASLGFILRGIGDKRAVPALIRAIPKTLVIARSDMGLRSEDAELAEFLQKIDLNPVDQPNRYDFGRAVREVGGALRTLTGQKLEEGEIFSVYRDGLPSQLRAKEQLFYRVAESWRDWWEANWATLIDDPAYAKVNLPPPVLSPEGLPLPNTAEVMIDPGFSNALLQSVQSARGVRVFKDLDTGRDAALPARWRNQPLTPELRATIDDWARAEGFDLVGDEWITAEGRRTFAIRALGLKAWELGPERWKANIHGVTLLELQQEGRLVKDWLLHADAGTRRVDAEKPGTFLYVTDEGTTGILYIGIEVQDDSLKPGGTLEGDHELNPIHFWKGRRYGGGTLTPVK